MNAEVVVYLIAVMIDKGVPALFALMQNWKQIDPTMEDFQKLKTLIIDPRGVP